MIKFSIGIPAFKSVFLKECIDSILKQDYQYFELIIVDDCSPEPIDKIVSSYSDSRIKYFKNETNIGAEHVVDNWNICLEKSSGDYFILMGDDDKLQHNYLQEFIKLIKQHPGLSVYHCRSKIIDETSKPYSITSINPDYENVYDFILSCIKQHRHQYVSDFVYKTESLKARGGFYKLPLAWASDYLSAWIASIENGIAHTNITLFNYRMNRYSITSSNNIRIITLKTKALIQCNEWLQEFLETPPSDEDNFLKYSLIQVALAKKKKTDKISAIKQIIGLSNPFYGALNIIKARKELHITSSDILSAFISSIFSKIDTSTE
ncbi:glycosyltransferase [Hymenobacter sp. BT186]|uniref:Glycosyltransferase n=1 Tax=Hymenobacter telluris TaxID=2816474 RepID=A0A939EVP7_9BACT|nr:glycosyltransferase [Hymenobacter telluris]MBO0357500.1 glycosyltransferase [Hymenobacter telluris]MBW3373526.1 glycosyltransferase [Hymenobacter norwichensis]